MGFENYLCAFARFKIRTLRSDQKEKDFFHFLSMLNDGHGDVLDVGANIGVMTWHLSRALPRCVIHAVEPMPINLKIIRRIIDKYALSNVEVYPVAVGEEQGQLKMILPHNGKTRMHGLAHVKHDSITEWNEGEEVDVAVDTLDHLFEKTIIQGIKMDVENFEYFALKGGSSLIERCNPIIYTELWDNENRVQCFDFLASKGYKAHVVIDNKLVPFQADQHRKQNFIFLPNQ